MIRTVLALGVGFWLARQIYVNQDKKEARKGSNSNQTKVKQLFKR